MPRQLPTPLFSDSSNFAYDFSENRITEVRAIGMKAADDPAHPSRCRPTLLVNAVACPRCPPAEGGRIAVRHVRKGHALVRKGCQQPARRGNERQAAPTRRNKGDGTHEERPVQAAYTDLERCPVVYYCSALNPGKSWAACRLRINA